MVPISTPVLHNLRYALCHTMRADSGEPMSKNGLKKFCKAQQRDKERTERKRKQAVGCREPVLGCRQITVCGVPRAWI